MKTKIKCFVKTVVLSFFILFLAQFGNAQDKALTLEEIIPGMKQEFKIETKLGEKCLKVKSEEDRASMLLGPCQNALPFYYKLEDAGDGYYYIKVMQNNKNLYLEERGGPQPIVRQPVLVQRSVLYDTLSPNGKLNFEFLPEDAGDGYYYIKSPASSRGERYLYVQGAEVWWSRDEDESSKFRFTPAEVGTTALNIREPVEETFYVDGNNDEIQMSSKSIEDNGLAATNEMIGFKIMASNKVKKWKQFILFDKNENMIKTAQLDSDGRISSSQFGESIKIEFYKPKYFLWWERRELVGTKYWNTAKLKGLDVTFTWMNE